MMVSPPIAKRQGSPVSSVLHHEPQTSPVSSVLHHKPRARARRVNNVRFAPVARLPVHSADVVSAMPTAVDGVDVARVFLGREYDGLAIELVVLSLAVFLLRYAVVLYASHLGGLHAAVVGDGSSLGLDGAAIARLPCFVLVRRGGGDDGDATADYCAVCLGAVEEGETVRALPCCRHAFHARCVDAWLRLRPTCPVCRGTCR